MLQTISSRLGDNHNFQPGDVVAFGGYTGVFTYAIRAATVCPVSHVGVISHIRAGRPLLAESTTLYQGRKGFQQNDLYYRLEDYAGQGRVWWLPLSQQARRHFDAGMFQQFLSQQHGKNYDYLQVLGVALARVPLLGRLVRPDDYTRLFCSELVGGSFEAAGILNKSWDTSHMTPEQICQLRLYRPAVQILGSPRAIRGYAKIQVFFPEDPVS